MKKYILFFSVFLSFSSFANDFDLVKIKSVEYLNKLHATSNNDILEIDIPYITTPAATPKGIERHANATVRIFKNGKYLNYKLQLVKKNKSWRVYRELNNDQLFTANPIISYEYISPDYRETSKLETIVSKELETRLRGSNEIEDVKTTYPSCFANIKFKKGICTIWYTTWEKDDLECIFETTVYHYDKNKWVKVKGKFHEGMRIHEESGEIYEMIPKRKCSNS